MIYCVERDGRVLQMMLYGLDAAGFQARGFSDGNAFLQAVAEEKPELVLLDDVGVLSRLRSRSATAQLPVIMTIADNDEFDRVVGLERGVAQCLCKPFGMMQMVCRVRAVLGR